MAKCWVLQLCGQYAYYAGVADEMYFLLVFTTEEKALRFLQNICDTPDFFTAVEFCWRDMVKSFREDYNFVAVDETGSPQDARLIQISHFAKI